MIEIRNFTATDHEFNELARIDNLVNHDSISHPDEDKMIGISEIKVLSEIGLCYIMIIS